MKRVENMHINGVVFGIESDALGQLSAYMDALSSYFRQEPGGSEIMADIEARVAELFAERAGGAGQVVDSQDVLRVMAMLGTIEDITGAGGEQEANPHAHSAQAPKPPQKAKLYRDADKGYLGGVCAGFASWLGIHAAIPRVLLVGLIYFGGAGLLIYLVCWMLIPAAKTTAQKLEMRGEPVNISNIEKNIKEQVAASGFQQSLRQFMSEAGSVANTGFAIALRVVSVVVGIWLILCGLGIVVGLGCWFLLQRLILSNEVEWDLLSFNELFAHTFNPASYHVALACAGLAVALTVVAFIFWGIRLIGLLKVRITALHVGFLVLWVACILVLAGVATREALQWAAPNHITETKTLIADNTLYIKAVPMREKLSNNPIGAYVDKATWRFYGKPKLHIYKSDDERIRLEIRREAQGQNKREAYQNAENISYEASVQDSLLVFPEYFGVTPENQWKFQSVNIVLYLPVGKQVHFEKEVWSTQLYFYWTRHAPSDSVSTWVMTESDGLQQVQ